MSEFVCAPPKTHRSDFFSKLLVITQANQYLTQNDFPAYPATTGTAFSDLEAEQKQGFAAASVSDAMQTLEKTAQAGNEVAFMQAAAAVDWTLCSGKDYARAIRLALKAGAHVTARRLTEQGVERYPEQAELQELASLLTPKGNSPARSSPPDPSAAADMRWLKANRERYHGQWVALRSGTLIASAPSAKALLSKLDNPQDKSLLLTAVY